MRDGASPPEWERIAGVAAARRSLLLRAYRGRLRDHDLEDCYSQATLELLLRAQRSETFKSAAHIGHALEQKLSSRIQDRRRALAGRSPLAAAVEGALAIGQERAGCCEVSDPRAPVEERVDQRLTLQSIVRQAQSLTGDQRLALAFSIGGNQSPGQFAKRQGWSAEKQRKVTQRARKRLRELVEADRHLGERASGGPASGSSSDCHVWARR